jgi:hypothetical protein
MPVIHLVVGKERDLIVKILKEPNNSILAINLMTSYSLVNLMT